MERRGRAKGGEKTLEPCNRHKRKIDKKKNQTKNTHAMRYVRTYVCNEKKGVYHLYERLCMCSAFRWRALPVSVLPCPRVFPPFFLLKRRLK